MSTTMSKASDVPEADIHRTYISDLERGARNPTISVIEKLARYLKVSAGDLLD